MDGPIVKTPLGQIQGAVYKTERGETIYTFLGVAYAKPPIDNLRFKVNRFNIQIGNAKKVRWIFW